MALSTALSSALKGRTVKTSTAGNTYDPTIAKQVASVGGNVADRQATRNALLNKLNTGVNAPTGTPTGATPTNPMASGTPVQPGGTQPTPTPVTPTPTTPIDPNLQVYKANLGITDEYTQQNSALQDQAAANAKASGDFSYADYYKALSDSSGRTKAQQDLISLQGQQANIDSGISLQDNEVSKGDNAMLDQARQNEFRSRPMREQLALNIARQGVQQNAINLANSDIKTQMDFKQLEFKNKADAIKTQLEALKGKVPDYMIKYAESNLASNLQKAQQTYAQQLKDGDVNSTDPVIQKIGVKNAVQAVYDKYGPIISRSPDQITSEIQGLMKTGMSFKDAMQKNLMEPLQSKSNYGTYSKSMENKALGISNNDVKTVNVKNPDGTETTMQWNGSGWSQIVNPLAGGSVSGDLRGLANQFPGQAWAKNNNPAGITWNANFDNGQGTAKLFADAGIQFAKGTSRPSNEGGNYVTFATIEDGLKAQQIIMSQTYGNSTVGQMLSSWVGTNEGPNYANQVAGMAGVDPNVKVSSLTPEQLSTLQMAKIQKESPGLAKLLQSAKPDTTEKPIDPSKLSLFEKYKKDGILPSKDALKGLGMTSEQFTQNADKGYNAFLDQKAKEVSAQFPTLDLQYTPTYATITDTQREKLNESLSKIGDIDNRITQLKDLFVKNGTEVFPTDAKSKMESLRKQIILKAKEMENLGVLNGPDLGILEDLLPSTTGTLSGLFSFDSNTLSKINNIQENYRSDASSKAIGYGAKLTFKDQIEPGNDTTDEVTGIFSGGGQTFTPTSGKTFIIPQP